MKESQTVRAVLGSMTFGGQVDEAGAERMVRLFLDSGGREIDTAYIYQEGQAEEMLGRVLKPLDRERLYIATKAHPSATGKLDAAAVTDQLETSLKRLGIDCADLFYLHQPDLSTPIEITLEACAKLHGRGLFHELGLSNYAAWQVADIHHICRREGWPAPTVYQGMYNAITRDVERELFPCLRALGLRFYAYNPLAAGVLSGKYSGWKAQAPAEGRFHDYDFYRPRYWKESYLQAAERVRPACAAAGVSMAAAALRWLAHHSRMSAAAGDGTIVGASRVEHAEANLAACAAGPLPEEVAAAFDAAWDLARPDCPKYFRT